MIIIAVTANIIAIAILWLKHKGDKMKEKIFLEILLVLIGGSMIVCFIWTIVEVIKMIFYKKGGKK